MINGDIEQNTYLQAMTEQGEGKLADKASFKNSEELLNSSNMCGFYELDAQGTVLYSRPKHGGKFDQPNWSAVGLNFFTDIFHCRNANDLRRRFTNFVSEKHSTETFVFGGQTSEKVIPLRVMFVCISERNENKREVRFYVDLNEG